MSRTRITVRRACRDGSWSGAKYQVYRKRRFAKTQKKVE